MSGGEVVAGRDLPINPVDTASRADVVLEQMFDLFLSGELELGQRLPSEADLAKRFGIGRNTVREAMKVLQVLGVVERRQGEGSRVAREIAVPLKPLLLALLSRMKTSSDMVDLRRIWEVGLGDLVIERLTEADIDSMERSIAELEACADNPAFSPAERVDRDLAFHRAMLASTRERAVIELGTIIMQLFAKSMEHHLSSDAGVRRAVEDHRRILDGLRQHDREGARQAIVGSYRTWRHFIRIGDEEPRRSEDA
jgi:GntR family transcriptional repressor for pyruvate dehydrogenase complex